MSVYVLNTAILTNYGQFNFRKIEIEEAKELLQGGFVSAVGHNGTAEVLTQLLGISIPVNRIAINMEKNDSAIVFRLQTRLPEGAVLSEKELKALPYELGLITRTE